MQQPLATCECGAPELWPVQVGICCKNKIHTGFCRYCVENKVKNISLICLYYCFEMICYIGSNKIYYIINFTWFAFNVYHIRFLLDTWHGPCSFHLNNLQQTILGLVKLWIHEVPQKPIGMAQNKCHNMKIRY